MNVARMNMSHGDHASHQKVIDLVKEYNAQSKDNAIAIMLDTKVMPKFLLQSTAVSKDTLFIPYFHDYGLDFVSADNSFSLFSGS